MNIIDADVRSRALDCSQSFIVQAPAGSGKTELLTQRFLKLLARVPQAPEEVLAITFTRKAASEMRQRVQESLQRAATEPQPDSEPAATNWRIAQEVLSRDAASEWNLLESPNRLRIMTIDGFCNSLVRQMPLLTNLGSVPTVSERSDQLYLLAAESALAAIQRPGRWEDERYLQSLKLILTHLDNHVDRLKLLVASMLAKRDQWLTHVAPFVGQTEALREQLQSALEMVVEMEMERHLTQIEALEALLGGPIWIERLSPLIHFAGHNLRDSLDPLQWSKHPFRPVYDDEQSAVQFWQAVAHLLTTKNQSASAWRKGRGVTKNLGFINPKPIKNLEEKEAAKQAKEQLVELLNQLNDLSESAHPIAIAGLDALSKIGQLPGEPYKEAQWQNIEALITILLRAVAELQLVFQLEGVVDFNEIAMSAARALGDEDHPTDLALKLDYQIHHILIDEFQDTSISQFELLRRLVRGWLPEDGRTLFLVGDPMQSIYRFREADVTLFLKARYEGVGGVPVKFLQLGNNFRSYPEIVNWVNQHFVDVLPKEEDRVTGAVTYSESMAAKDHSDENPTDIEIRFESDGDAQAKSIVEKIQSIRSQRPKERIAILVRARTHSEIVVAQLREAHIPYQAVEIEGLAEKPLIQDLLSLTKAIYFWSDRIAWLAILRAPWCGLSLADLYHLLTPNESLHLDKAAESETHLKREGGRSGSQFGGVIWEACLTAERERFTTDCWQRLSQFRAVMEPLLSQRNRYSVRETVEGAWIALGGIAYTPKSDLVDAESYFQLLETVESGADISDIDQLEQQVQRLFTNPTVTADNPVQVMTIHKSKGLEFDTVFIPHIEKSGRYDEPALLSWLRLEHPDAHEELLLFAPIKESYGREDRIYEFIRQLEQQKSSFELGRLFYVAVTRAKRALYLLATVNSRLSEDEDSRVELNKRYRKNSLLNLLPESVLVAAQQEYQQRMGDQIDIQLSDEPASVSYQEEQGDGVGVGEELEGNANFNRLSAEWILDGLKPIVKPTENHELPLEPESEPVIDSRVGTKSAVELQASIDNREIIAEDNQWRRMVGTVLHRSLQLIDPRYGSTLKGLADHAVKLVPMWQMMLSQAGLPPSRMGQAIELLQRASQQMSVDHRAEWIFSDHLIAENELEISALAAPGNQKNQEAVVERFRIDRLMVSMNEDQTGQVLWIVDYKLSEPTKGQSEESFYQDQYNHYAAQLQRYGEIALSLYSETCQINEVKLALYFPLFGGWYSWS